MIAGALATLLASGAYFAADSIKTNANIYRNANRMDDEGVFWPTNPEVERMLQHDIRSLWETGKRDFIPEGLEGFFEENNSAREAYFDALAAQCMLENGCKPMDAWGSFNRHTYNCFLQYNRSHGADADEWLRIHKPEIILARIERTKKIVHEAQVASKKEADKSKIIFAIVLTLCLSLVVIGIVKMAIVKNELVAQFSQLSFYPHPDITKAINECAQMNSDYNAGLHYLVWGILLSSLVLMMGLPMVKGAKITVKL